MPEHPEVTAELSEKSRCIAITVIGGSKSTKFRTEETDNLWSAPDSPCPEWAQEAVRLWSRTPGALELFRQLDALKKRTI